MRKPKGADLVNLLIVTLPIAAWLEGLVRGSGASLWLRDWLLSGLATVSFLIVFSNLTSKHGYLWVLALVAIICTLHGLRVARRPNDPRGFLQTAGRTFITFWKYVAIVFVLVGWWVLAIKFPGWSALIALCGLAAYLATRERAFVRRNFAAMLGVASLSLFMLLQVHEFATAQTAGGVRIFERYGAYDIADNGRGLFVVTARHPDAFRLMPNQSWQDVQQAYNPQRMAVDRQTGEILLANYLGSRITIFDGIQSETIKTCRWPVDMAVDQDRRRLYVACEGIQELQVYQLDGDRSQIDAWSSQIMSYSLALDQVRHRLYTTSEILWGALEAFDTTDGSRSKIHPGLIVWGVAVDELTGNVWIARPLPGVLEVYDPQLRKLASVRVGTSPRDLAIDPQRRVLLAGNYFSGTLAVVDLDQMRLVQRLSVGSYSPLPLLTGVYVGTDGWWYTADRSGVWRIRPSVPPEPNTYGWPPSPTGL
ncbi:MAG: hypothetical protein P9M14_07020 [Candidatus Alcyoniella australis]|nr:hypothetical protein [Candidatus Alcyoniella australis]